MLGLLFDEGICDGGEILVGCVVLLAGGVMGRDGRDIMIETDGIGIV